MKKHTNILVKSRFRKEAPEIAKFLHLIADKVSDKKIKFAQGELETELALPDHIEFSVKAREKELNKKGLRRKITLELQWFEGGDGLAPIEVK